MAKANILTLETVKVPLKDLNRYPKNPRIGNIGVIAESLKENGQYRPLIVQKSTGYVLAGNHTMQAAEQLGWSDIAVNYIDVDDDRAKRIVLMDNRSQDLATYNAEILGEILDSLPSADLGTGYDSDAINSILASVQQGTTDALDNVLHPTPVPQTGDGEIGFEGDNSIGGSHDPTGAGSDFGTVDVNAEDPTQPVEPDKFNEASEEIKGAYGLKVDVLYENGQAWDIPPLRTDQLAKPEDIPRNLLAWAGSATKDWPDPDQWWLYNFGIDSTSGMRDVSKMIVSFYCWDHYFENWWQYPDRYVAKMLNSGVKMAVGPDFSQWSDHPRASSLWNLYRSRWLMRYFQDAGIKLIPNVAWRYQDYDYYNNVVRPTLPNKLPVIAIQLQTFDKDLTEHEREELKKFYEHVGQTCGPDLTIFYVGKQGKAVLEEINWPGEQLVVVNRMDALAAQAKGRQKKTTL